MSRRFLNQRQQANLSGGVPASDRSWRRSPFPWYYGSARVHRQQQDESWRMFSIWTLCEIFTRERITGDESHYLYGVGVDTRGNGSVAGSGRHGVNIFLRLLL